MSLPRRSGADDRAGDPGGRGALAVEVLLVAVTVVAVAGFGRLFGSAAAVAPLYAAALLAHGTAVGLRRARAGAVASFGVTVGGVVLSVSVVLYPHTSWFGLPTPTTLSTLGQDLSEAWELFGEVVAPAPASRGFLVAASLAIWVVAGLADWAAFRLRAVAEAVLPASALFVFTAILGTGSGGIPGTVALAAAILGFALAQRTRRLALEGVWVGGRARAGTATLARAGALTTVAVVALAGLAVPHLPGVDDTALVDWRGGDGPSSRLTVSPLVDIRSRLVQQSNTQAFTVVADQPAYWRLTSLDRFDGQVWSSSETFNRADGRLPSEPPGAATVLLPQEVTIASLGSIWAPAALTPVELVETSMPLQWNGELATLIVHRDREDIDDARYTVVSRVPRFTPDDLQAPYPERLPRELAEATALPVDLPPEVVDLAHQVVADAAPTPYAAARALQDWFRAEFTYDLAGVDAGHGGPAILAFLAQRRGYCEQFAGTFAAMARALGLPARVAVGFTPGQVGPDGRTYTVRGRNAHAWPEVWIPGAGWVPFEPTPGRGQPGTEAYTGVTPTQDPIDEPGPDDPPPGTTAVAPPAPDGPAELDPGDVVAGGGPAPGAPEDPGPPPRARWVNPALVAGLVLVLLAVGDLVGVAGVRTWRRWRRRRAGTDAARVRASWGEALDALARAGLRPAPAETDAEFARRAAAALAPVGGPLQRLAVLTTGATWAPSRSDPGPEATVEADGLARTVARRAGRSLTWRRRLLALADPRPLLRPR